MPNKYVDYLKDDTDRLCGQMWQNALDIEDMTTREWNTAAELASKGYDYDDIKVSILESR
jgi:hypothetical protein